MKLTAAEEQAIWQFRYDLCVEVGKCEVCGMKRAVNRICCHEIASGTADRRKARSKRFAILVVCALGCHDVVQNEPKAVQLARLYLNRPGDLDVVAFNRLRGRAPDAITVQEVLDAADRILEGRG